MSYSCHRPPISVLRKKQKDKVSSQRLVVGHLVSRFSVSFLPSALRLDHQRHAQVVLIGNVQSGVPPQSAYCNLQSFVHRHCIRNLGMYSICPPDRTYSNGLYGVNMGCFAGSNRSSAEEMLVENGSFKSTSRTSTCCGLPVISVIGSVKWGRM